MKTVTYEEYIDEVETMKRKLEEQTLVKDVNDMIWMYNTGSGKCIEMVMNVSATGRLTPIEAERFSHCIVTAAKLIKEFKYNGYTITYGEIGGENGHS